MVEADPKTGLVVGARSPAYPGSCWEGPPGVFQHSAPRRLRHGRPCRFPIPRPVHWQGHGSLRDVHLARMPSIRCADLQPWADLRLSSSRVTCRGTVPVPKPLQKGKSNDTLPIGLRRALQFGPSRLFTSCSAWQMCRVPRNTDFALPMPTHAVPVRAQASPSMRK
uniref:Uncharacterized protein n=1 Tax=Candidatus Kentrum sp. LFY TaxID=2126342 RepID=A0A450W9J4_9GAMM|nr:MAG: hypothetical protein BECKLFY1418C_GA0070996_100432 [Candidatus Kentron sp. LFY]